MQRFSIVFVALLTAGLAGCGTDSTAEPPVRDDSAEQVPTVQPGDTALESSDAAQDESGRASAWEGEADAPPAEDVSRQIALTPENTTIQFVGTHVGDKPDPRTGNFTQFSGTATVTGGQLSAIDVKIQTESLVTELDKLTGHLKSPDFFDVATYPTASFATSEITAGAGDAVTVTGKLTLLDKTQPISFPATVSTENGLTLEAEFTIDRTEFGMTYSPDKVEATVTMTITVNAT